MTEGVGCQLNTLYSADPGSGLCELGQFPAIVHTLRYWTRVSQSLWMRSLVVIEVMQACHSCLFALETDTGVTCPFRRFHACHSGNAWESMSLWIGTMSLHSTVHQDIQYQNIHTDTHTYNTEREGEGERVKQNSGRAVHRNSWHRKHTH